MDAGNLPRRWPPKIFVLGCVIALSANLLAGAIERKWIFYLGLVIALPMIGLGIRTFLSRMDDEYREGLSRIQGHRRNIEEGSDKD
jgi:hypothetical protein